MNLGNIKNAKAGDEVCTVKITNGELTVCVSIAYVKGPNLPHYPNVTFVTPQPGDKNQSGAFTTGEGKMCPGMYPNDYWYSMNPVHIKEAKKMIKAAQAKTKRKQVTEEKKLKEFKRKLDALLKEYDASIYPNQTHGDDQGVEIELEISIGSATLTFE